ncbi:MAG: choice-of-anchor Q domain-containing protein [Chitinispirillaceae bacterium]
MATNPSSINSYPFAIIAIMILHASYSPISAETFYVDPLNGSMSNDGSENSPWSTLKEVFDSSKIESYKYESKPAAEGAPMIIKNENAPVKAGDTLLLGDGFHGKVYASEYYNTDYITIMAQPGHSPKVSSIELRSGCKWIISGLTVSPEFDPVFEKRTLIQFASHGWTGASYDCVVENCIAYSADDITSWSVDDWNDNSCNALSLPGDKMVARNNHFRNINFGISVTGDSCLVENNIIENFSGDGLRGIGDYGTYQYNTVKNCYDVNANHDDGFQSWSVGEDGVGTGVVKGIVLRGNTIINYEDPNQPHRGTLQGIGCFDGMFEDWVVENNVIMVDHWHGITLSGAINCRIVNNTVVDLNSERPGPPWIRISNHKNGTASTGCTIRNNLTTSISADDGVAADHNIVIENYDDFFVDYTAFDLRLKPGCIAIDSGNADLAPQSDRNGNDRIVNGRIDVGAYEYDPNSTGVRFTRFPFRKTDETFSRMHIFDLRGRLIGNVPVENMRSVNNVILNKKNLGSSYYLFRPQVSKKSRR